jgi:hypothetical protein
LRCARRCEPSPPRRTGCLLCAARVLRIGGIEYFKTFAQLLATDHYSAIKQLLARRQIILDNSSVRAVIESDQPADATATLAEPFPSAPSGELIYDHDQQRWVDSLEGWKK